MAWKSSSIVSYPDSDDDNDPLHYIKKSRPKQDNVQYTPVYKNKVGKIAGHPRDPRLESRNRDPRLQPKTNESRDPRLHSRNVENREFRALPQTDEASIHYEPVYNRKVRDIGREIDHASRANSYESAGARWKQYKSEKAAEISKPDKYQSAESGWKKLKSENKWNTSHWTRASDSSDDEDKYNRKTPKSKIDIYSNSQEMEEACTEEKPRGNDFWWKYKDDDPVTDSSLLEHAPKSEEKNDDLFDDILSGNLAESKKSTEKTDDFNDDFLYEDVLMQSRKVLEEGKAFLGETVNEKCDRGKDHYPIFHEGSFDKSRNAHDSVSSQNFRSEDHMLTEKRFNDCPQYHAEPDDKTENHLYKHVDHEFEDNGETWARSITVEKKDDSNWSDESLSPIRRDEQSEDRDVEVNLVKKRSPSRTRNDSSSSHDAKEKRKDEKVSNLSPPRQEPRILEPAQPVLINPYDNPKLNVDNISKYFDDLMEWNYSHRCLICDKTFENLTKWTEHILDTKHGREFHLDPYRCPPCHEMFRSKQEWKMHMAYAPSHGFMGSINMPKPCTVLPPSPAFPVQHGWRCKGCYIISQTDEDAMRHIKYVHLIHSAQYPCPLCGEPFWHQRDLDRHADDVHAPPKYHCDICQRAFESSEKLQTHRLIKHSKKITCYRCEKQIDELIFKEHCEMHKLEMRKCDYCGDVFKDSYHLDKHIRNDHKKRHRYRSSSRSPDRRSSRRRSRRSSSRSRRSSSKSRKSSTRDEQRKKEKSVPDDSPTRKEVERQTSKEIERSRSQDDSSIPSSSGATPTRDEEEDIYPPGDENYRQSSPKQNIDIKEAAPVEDENTSRDEGHSSSRSPLGRRDSRDDHHRSRQRDRSNDYRRSRSRSHDARDRRSSRSEKGGSRDKSSSRRYHNDKRSRSRSREKEYDRKRRSMSNDNDRDYGSHCKDRGYVDSVDKYAKDESGNMEHDRLNNSSSNAQDSPSNDVDGDDDETEWERKISAKMIVKDEIWDKEEDDKSNDVSYETVQKDLPIFDIPMEEDIKKSSSENPIENATWVVEKPLDENKDLKSEHEGDEEEKKQFVCKECGKSLGSLMQLRDHFTVKHKKGYNLRNKRISSSEVKKSQPVLPKEPKLSEEQKEIAKLIEGIE